ncbi:MAG: ImmA/IrrE family metallo-endopeptidase [Gammaproteobacteria bacterium]
MRRPRTKEIRQKAETLLSRHRIAAAPIPVEEIAAAEGARVRYSPFEGELAGMLVRGHGQTVIGVNSLHHPNRQRFTIAHELGHLLLHKDEVHIDRSFRVNRRDEVSSLAVDPDEIEANRFAAELLMPYNLVMADLLECEIDLEDEDEIRRLAKKYEVSLQAMTHRIINLLKLG